MAKVKVKNLDKINEILKDFFANKTVTKSLLEEVSTFSRERIKSFTRSGKSLADGSAKRLKPLSESYKDMRRGAVKYRTLKDGRVIALPEPDERLNEVDVNFFDPTFSNLTFTGQMLNAVKSVIDITKRTVSIFVDDTKRKGKYEKLTNAQVAEYVADNGRPFLGLDDTSVKRVRQLVVENIRKQIIKSGLKK